MSLFLNRRSDGSYALFIDGDLQFDSRDERIYHECLALPALALAEARTSAALTALIVGGGDGLTARELLKSQRVAKVDLVDYDPAVLEIARGEIRHLNDGSLFDSRMNVHVEDAWNFVQNTDNRYDLIVVDLTVARNQAGARFHSVEWYEHLSRILKDKGIAAVNCLSPSATPQAFWSIINSCLTGQLHAVPYRTTIPSFIERGYGQDWGFMLASAHPISKEEITPGPSLKLAQPRHAIADAEHLLNLFLFPEVVAKARLHADAATQDSDVLLHYMQDFQALQNFDAATWNSMASSLPLLTRHSADRALHLLPPQICSPLKCATENDAVHAEEIFEQVLTLMPTLQRSKTRELILDFLADPGSLLEAIDIGGLVDRLLTRAKELPQRIVAELELLQEKLAQWTGDHLSLFALGTRVVTILSVVVILANLMYPDAAYGKGEHGGGGHGGDHGGGHGGEHAGGRGDRGGDRGGDRAGDRGFNRAGDRGFNRGFDRGYRGGYDNHWNHWSHWGGGWGHYGGWARPWHRWSWGGWGGGWGSPAYAAGPGFLNLSIGGGSNNNNNNNQSVDHEGTLYPARQYNYVNEYENAPDGVQTDQNSQNQSASVYRLGPDSDILPDGKVTLQLTDGAYLLLAPDADKVIDQASGKTVMSLNRDDSLTWHIASEIKRQSLGLQSAGQSKQSGLDWSGKTGMPTEQKDQLKEVTNIQSTAQLLDKARAGLGTIPDQAPQAAAPPAAGAIEVFSGVWMTADGKYAIVQRADGSTAYLDGKGWYSDASGSNKIAQPYPTKFASIVASYLGSLSKEAGSTKDSMMHDQQEVQDHMQTLTDDLAKYNSAGGSPEDMVDFGTNQITRQEALRRTKYKIRRAQQRLEAIQSQLNSLPTETAAANKLLANLQADQR